MWNPDQEDHVLPSRQSHADTPRVSASMVFHSAAAARMIAVCVAGSRPSAFRRCWNALRKNANLPAMGSRPAGRRKSGWSSRHYPTGLQRYARSRRHLPVCGQTTGQGPAQRFPKLGPPFYDLRCPAAHSFRWPFTRARGASSSACAICAPERCRAGAQDASPRSGLRNPFPALVNHRLGGWNNCDRVGF